MTPKKQTGTSVRPMRVFVGPNTNAERGFHSRKFMPKRVAIAPGLPTTPEHDLVFQGGNTIANLVFTNFYVGGSDAWDANDIQSIDAGLSAAMSDRNLNNVMVQYYPSGQITSNFSGSQILAGPPPAVVSQGDVESLVRSLFQTGTLSGIDFTSTVLNFMLPSGTILNTDPAPTSSTIQGLGGYHGSVHVITGSDSQTVYYAVGVYSENRADGTTNGIPVFDESWKNVVATFYHELNEARTDPDVEDAIRAGNDPNAGNFLGWVSSQGEECGDFPVFEANPLSEVFQEVHLTDASGTVPIQFQYSDANHGPGLPRTAPAPFAGQRAETKAG